MEQKIDLDVLEAALAKASLPDTMRILSATISLHPQGPDMCSNDEQEEYFALAHNALPALIAELRELRAESAAIKARAWQSIETAPKNGTGFLAWNESLRIVEASWWSDNMAGITHWQPFPDGPTHALPLPPAPEARP